MPNSKSEPSNAKPISLAPLRFEEALKGLLAVDPGVIKSPKKSATRKNAAPKKQPTKKKRKK
jgi:hypothetical protein